jgi:hypothetical protein
MPIMHRKFRLAETARRFAQSTSGNVAIIFALSLPILIGAVGLGVETSYWYYRFLQLQSAADAAAYAAELESLSGSPHEAVEAVATLIATENGFEPATGSIAVFSPPSSGPNTGAHAAEVRLRQELERYFTAIFSDEPVTLSARAVARSEHAYKACMLALNESASRAALFSGSAVLRLTGCAVMSNSRASDALRVQGSALLEADCLISAGGVQLNNGVVMTSCPAPITHALAAPDPFSDLPVPDPTGACQNAQLAILQPGRYCHGLRLSGVVQLNPGVYVLQGGDFRVNANAVVTGTGVVVYLSCGSRVTMNGTATVQLDAPTIGSYAGILFYGDRDCDGGSNTFNGTAASRLTGALYFARQDVQFLGNFSGAGGCSQIVAGTIQWSGNTSINQDCTSLGMRDIPGHQLVRLVE